MSQPHSQLNSDVLRAWCDAPGHFLPPEPPTAASASDNARSRDSSPQRHRYTPAEVSQYSVDLLLREYYKIVTSQQKRHTGRMYKQSEEGGLVQRAFLLLCPAPPACLELDHIVKATVRLVTLSARALTLSACLLVPALLAFIRRVQTEQGQAAAALLTFSAVLLLLVADTISRRSQQQQQQAQAACVTAATLQQQLQQAAGAGSNELATLRAASKTATTSNSSRPTGAAHHSASAPRTQQPAAAAAPAGGSRPGSIGGSGAAATTCAALELELAALQAALGVSVSSRHAPGTREHVADVLKQLSEQLGVQAAPDATASPAAMAAAVVQLKQSVGI